MSLIDNFIIYIDHMQKYDPEKSYNFLNMVPPWSNFRIDVDDDVRSPETLTAYLKLSASFPQTFDTFHDYDGLMYALQKTEKGAGIKILGRVYDFMLGETINLRFRGCFSFKKAVLLDELQVHSAVEEWLKNCKLPESIMGLSVEFQNFPLSAKSLEVFMESSNSGGCKINYAFDVNVRMKHSIKVKKLEAYNKIVVYRPVVSSRDTKIDYSRWKLLHALAIYGKMLNVDKENEKYILYRPIENYREKLLEYKIQELYHEPRYHWSYLSLVPLAIVAGYGNGFKSLWEKYGDENIYAFDFVKGWKLWYSTSFVKVSFAFWLKEGNLKTVLDSLEVVKKNLMTKCKKEHCYDWSTYSCDFGWKMKKPLNLYLSMSDVAEKSFDNQCDELRKCVLAFFKFYEKFLKSLYKKEPNAKITCSDIVRRLAPAFCERIRKNPELFLKSENYYIADYAKSLIPAN